MPQLFPPEIIENTVECYHAHISTKSKVIYGLILLIIMFVFGSVPIFLEVIIEFLLKVYTLNDDDLININAGNCTFLLPSSILDGTNISLYSYLAEYKESAHRL